MSKFSTFLDDVAEDVLRQHNDPGSLKVIFPNRRAGLFFQQRLAKKLTKAVWSPTILTMEEFVYSFSTSTPADPLTLVIELFQAFSARQSRVNAGQEATMEGFEKFYFWGEMLMRDFQDIDMAMVAPADIFRGVKNQKELDEFFYFLSEEEQKAIKSFWQSFFPEAGHGQQQFLKTWEILLPVYESFNQNLASKNLGYQGNIYKNLAVRCKKGAMPTPDTKLAFAGFNALTPAEEEIIKYFVGTHDATVYWDYDDYYVSDEQQEAGKYLRSYKGDPVLGKTFATDPPLNFQTSKQMEAVAVSLEVGQAKAAAAYLEEKFTSGEFTIENTVLVLPQEHMLFPVLNSLPPSVAKFNVTMGFPLKDTPLYSLVEGLLQLPGHFKLDKDSNGSYYYKSVVSILTHPYIYTIAENDLAPLLADIRKKNMVKVPQQLLTGISNNLVAAIFQQPDDGKSYLGRVNHTLRGLSQGQASPDADYFFHFFKVFDRLHEILVKQDMALGYDTLLKLFRQVARSMKIPFSGEPLEGMQVMGVLETRNLDFENVVVLSMNEDSFPASPRSGSFIPYNIRRAFGLPTFEQNDAIYAYLFYRLVQRAKHVRFYYNAQAEFGMNGELSRFVQQLKVESPHQVGDLAIASDIAIAGEKPIVVEKKGSVKKVLFQYLEGGSDKLAPTALANYLHCHLRFYFQYIARLRETDQVQEQLDPALFGNILHSALELLYKNLIETKKSPIVTPNDYFMLESGVDGVIDTSFREYYHTHHHQKFRMEGRNVIMFNLVKDYMMKILEIDKAYAPFEIVALEGKGKGFHALHPFTIDGTTYKAALKGTIDRIDLKAGVVRILDYKTGRDKRVLNKDIPSLFNPKEKDRNKAAFQLFIYSMLYQEKYGDTQPIAPGIFNITELYTDGFAPTIHWPNGSAITDIRPYLEMFKEQLSALLAEIFDEAVPFAQTDDLTKCEYCPYNGICHRA